MQTHAVNMHEAKTNLSQLVEQAEAGQEIVIARAGRPVAKLVAISAPERKVGLMAGLLEIPDDFDAPLPDEVLSSFYGEQ